MPITLLGSNSEQQIVIYTPSSVPEDTDYYGHLVRQLQIEGRVSHEEGENLLQLLDKANLLKTQKMWADFLEEENAQLKIEKLELVKLLDKVDKERIKVTVELNRIYEDQIDANGLQIKIKKLIKKTEKQKTKIERLERILEEEINKRRELEKTFQIILQENRKLQKKLSSRNVLPFSLSKYKVTKLFDCGLLVNGIAILSYVLFRDLISKKFKRVFK